MKPFPPSHSRLRMLPREKVSFLSKLDLILFPQTLLHNIALLVVFIHNIFFKKGGGRKQKSCVWEPENAVSCKHVLQDMSSVSVPKFLPDIFIQFEEGKNSRFSFPHLPHRFCFIHNEPTEGNLLCIPTNLQLPHAEAELHSKCNYLVFSYSVAPPNTHYISYTFLTWKPRKISELFCDRGKMPSN